MVTTRLRDHVFYRDYTKQYPTIARGEGVYLYDDEGKRYFDACGGAVVVNVGHGRAEVAEAIGAQARAIGYISSQRVRTQIQIDLSERLAAYAPGDLNAVFFVSSGSEANESALKLARHHSQDKGRADAYKVIARWQSYHGNTIGAMSMGGRTGGRARYTPLLLDFPHIVPPYCYRCPYGLEPTSCDLACARDLERTIRQVGANSVSAFIAEPVIGATLGAAVPPDGYYPLIREICDKYDILFIADEVMSGMGRTGAWFAIEHWGVLPDIICFGKGISSGYTPLSGMIVSQRIVDLLVEQGGRFGHGHTHTANPVTLAAGMAVLDILEREHLVERARTQGAYLMERLQTLRERRYVGDVRGKGLMVGVEFVRDKASKEPFAANVRFADRVVQRSVEKGAFFLVGTGTVDGVMGDFIIVAPPFIVSNDEIDEIVAILDATLRELEREVRLDD